MLGADPFEASHLLPPFFIRHFRIRKAVGITSKVGDSHILLVDCDAVGSYHRKIYEFALSAYPSSYIFSYTTPNGLHLIILTYGSLLETAKKMLDFPYIDKSFVAVGLRRGYWFLETPVPIVFPNVNYERIDRHA